MNMSKAIAKMNFQEEAEVTNRLGGAKLPLSRQSVSLPLKFKDEVTNLE